MPRDVDDYVDFEREAEAEVSDYTEGDSQESAPQRENVGLLDQLTDLVTGDAELAFELDDGDDDGEDLDPLDPEYERKAARRLRSGFGRLAAVGRSTGRRVASVGISAGRTVAGTAKQASTAAATTTVRTARTLGTLAKTGARVVNPIALGVAARGVSAGSSYPSGGARVFNNFGDSMGARVSNGVSTVKSKVKRTLIKTIILLVVLGIVLSAIRVTPAGPIVDKINETVKRIIGKLAKYKPKMTPP